MNWRKYLLCFAQDHVDFRETEIQSIIKMFKIAVQWIHTDIEKPYRIAQFQSENDLLKFASRSVTLHYALELWCHGKTTEELHSTLKDTILDKITAATINNTFKIRVETYNRHFTQKEKVNKIEEFNYLPFTGEVNLKNPQSTYYYVEFYGLDPNDVPEYPCDVYFGKWICDGARHLICKLSLKKRKFIGNTSMESQLSLLMANFAQVKPGDLVLDPFVGSGSLLVAAAQFGGFVVGSDIDYLMLYAKTRPSRITQKVREKDESVKSNMEQYELRSKYVDVVISDFSQPLWRSDLKFDSIITDPPYGIREATERIGSEKSNREVEERHLATHIPSKVGYHPSKIYRDLLNFSAQHLVMNGRLVCWIPVHRYEYNASNLPSHPCLQLVGNSEQVLSKYASRRLLTYQKLKEYDKDSDCILDPIMAIPDFRDRVLANLEVPRKERRLKKAIHNEEQRLKRLNKEN